MQVGEIVGSEAKQGVGTGGGILAESPPRRIRWMVFTNITLEPILRLLAGTKNQLTHRKTN